MEGLATAPLATAGPPKVINLMEASKRSLAQDAEPDPGRQRRAGPSAREAGPDRHQRALLLPVPGGRGKTDTAGVEAKNSAAARRRKKAG